MSNLTLPTMTFGALAASIRPSGPTKIAYATTAEHGHDSDGAAAVIIRHHGNHIATLERNYIRIECAGWSSSTTAARLHRVLVDNRTGFGAGIRQGVLHVINMDDRRTKAADITGDGAYAAFYRDNGDEAWTLAVPAFVARFEEEAR